MKWESLENALGHYNAPSCVFIQETKLKSLGNRKLKGYTINAYGPQETDTKENITGFWNNIELQIVKAKNEGCYTLIQMDANAKLGHTVIPNDPNIMSSNGKLLYDIILRQNLVCLNAHSSCKGVITRHRKTKNSTETAVLDYVLVCEELSSFLDFMIIDEKRELILTKYSTSRGVRIKKESNHNSLFARFNINFSKASVVPRMEIFDFKDEKALSSFTELTEECKTLRDCFSMHISPEKCSKKFFKALEHTFQRAFKKIRIKPGQFRPRQCKEVKWLNLKTKLLEAKSKTSNLDFIQSIDKQIQFVKLQISKIIADKNERLLVFQWLIH